MKVSMPFHTHQNILFKPYQDIQPEPPKAHQDNEKPSPVQSTYTKYDKNGRIIPPPPLMGDTVDIEVT